MTMMLFLAIAASTAASAACPANRVCATDIQSIARGLQAAGYKAEVKRGDKTGVPYVSSAANGSEFVINLYACDDDDKKAGCKAMILGNWWKPAASRTVALANQFNSKTLYGRAYLNDDDEMQLEYGLAMGGGGISVENFKAVLDAWSAIDSDLTKAVEKAEETKPAQTTQR